MTQRKSPLQTFDTFIDRQIAEARDAGEFDDLPGAGKPLNLEGPRDDMWWVKEMLKREELSVLPPSLEIRRDLERSMVQLLKASREEDVRRGVDALNERIRRVNAYATSGPPTNLIPVDPEAVVARWRLRQERLPR